MITRRSALQLLSCAGMSFCTGFQSVAMAKDETPELAPGAPSSPERTALIEKFRKESQGLENNFEARKHKRGWAMPYRLFRPRATGKLPLVIYLHGSGGLGDDNEKQMQLGNIFGTRVWLLPENQAKYPCYVLAPQTDRGWVNYDLTQQEGPATVLPGFGAGSRVALEIVDDLRHEFAIDEKRIYVTGQSMGGAGVWNMLAYRKNLFAAAVVCCGSDSEDDGTGSLQTPVWAFHGDSDKTVPVGKTRKRITARRKAGGHPIYTEYAGIDHNVWQWAFTEPSLVNWLFEQRRG